MKRRLPSNTEMINREYMWEKEHGLTKENLEQYTKRNNPNVPSIGQSVKRMRRV